ncbi:hypothetical protein HMPREF0621_0973 [Pasteurella dagmatis ATCC 43325]|uniref:Uncharacterized protein n=1 Tax=Pasteurella dagmatis ATCC 43325 TaxID=667128 RepID=C9PPP9_9PAST|nr:hypothetical protein HMPREF0621_0973 [Pasteurella dagmatis ATCC 43325]
MVAKVSKLNQFKLPKIRKATDTTIEVAVIAMVYWILSLIFRVIKPIKMEMADKKQI